MNLSETFDADMCDEFLASQFAMLLTDEET